MKLDDFERDCVWMVMFDILIGQADRSPSNYGIVVDVSTNSARFAPLFDNATLTKPYIQNNMMSFNQLILDRRLAARIVFGMFNTLAESFRDKLSEKHDAILEVLSSTFPFHDVRTRDFLVERISEGVRGIEAL